MRNRLDEIRAIDDEQQSMSTAFLSALWECILEEEIGISTEQRPRILLSIVRACLVDENDESSRPFANLLTRLYDLGNDENNQQHPLVSLLNPPDEQKQLKSQLSLPTAIDASKIASGNDAFRTSYARFYLGEKGWAGFYLQQSEESGDVAKRLGAFYFEEAVERLKLIDTDFVKTMLVVEDNSDEVDIADMYKMEIKSRLED